MITRGKANAGRALADISNKITPLESSNSNQPRYNLRPRKDAAKNDAGVGGKKKVAKDSCGTQHRYNLRPRKDVAKKKDAGVGGKTEVTKKKQKKSTSDDLNASSNSPPPDDIDKRNVDDPQFATTYVDEIHDYLRRSEALGTVSPDYISSQDQINEHTRMILVNWLVEVHMKFKLIPSTLYLAVNIIDRYLAKEQVTRPKLQLVAISALFLASKYEEIYQVTLNDCKYICDEAYEKEEILDTETAMLKALNYQLSFPTAHTFLPRYLQAGHANTEIVNLSYYILDSTLQSYYLLHFLPSQLAAAAVFIARKTVGQNAWSPTLAKYAQYREEEVIEVARAVVTVKMFCSKGLHAVNKKYAHNKFGAVSSVVLSSDF